MSKIHEFDPVIYPCKLFVVLNPVTEIIAERFSSTTYRMNRIEFDHGFFEEKTACTASTFVVIDKTTGLKGVLVCIRISSKFDVSTACHEAVHCADFYAETFDIPAGSFFNGEPYAYLTGWIADCIWKVKSKRIK
jgi:hypothetical protein